MDIENENLHTVVKDREENLEYAEDPELRSKVR